MSILTALNGLLADTIDRLADRVAQAPAHQQATQTRMTAFLEDPSRYGGRALVAKMARAEVKNILAELAEEAERPFPGPAGFLRDIRKDLEHIGGFTTAPRDPDEPYDPDADRPYTVTYHERGGKRVTEPVEPRGSEWVPPVPQPPSDPDNAEAMALYQSVLRARGVRDGHTATCTCHEQETTA